MRSVKVYIVKEWADGRFVRNVEVFTSRKRAWALLKARNTAIGYDDAPLEWKEKNFHSVETWTTA